MNFGQRLKHLRNKHKITQKQLAKHLGVGRPTIAGYETKGIQPSYETLNKIADYFNVSIDHLLGRTDNETLPVKEPSPEYNVDSAILKEIDKLSPESQRELKKLIDLYKLKDMQKRNIEAADDLTNTE